MTQRTDARTRRMTKGVAHAGIRLRPRSTMLQMKRETIALREALMALIDEVESVAETAKEYDDPHTHELLTDSTKRWRNELKDAK